MGFNSGFKGLSHSENATFVVLRCDALFYVECAFIYGLRKPRLFGPGSRTGKRTVETIYFPLFLSCWISLSLFPFLTENCMGFGLEIVGNGCSQCRGFKLFDPRLLWCGGAALVWWRCFGGRE